MQKQFSHKVQSARIAAMFNPCTDSELVRDFATAPALAALLPDDIPLPVEPGEVEFQFSTGPGGVMPMTVVSVIVNRVMAFHWFLDTSDPVTWEVLDAWNVQRGFQVHVYHEGSETVLPLVLYLDDGVDLGESLGHVRRFCGQDLTSLFFAVGDDMCRHGAIELPFLLSRPELRRQSSWILATPNVMAYLEGMPACELSDAPSPDAVPSQGQAQAGLFY